MWLLKRCYVEIVKVLTELINYPFNKEVERMFRNLQTLSRVFMLLKC